MILTKEYYNNMFRIFHGSHGIIRYVLLAGILCSLPVHAQFKAQKSEKVGVYINDPDNKLYDHDLTILYIPLHKIRIVYINDTKNVVKKEFPDSFFIESAEDLIIYECSKRYAVSTYFEKPAELKDPPHLINELKYSMLKNDTAHYDSVSQCIIRTAEKFSVDLILFPYSCQLKNIVFQQKGWRNESPNTARPLKYKAQTAIHLQIWDKEGNLLYEKIGTNQTKRPILYSIFRKRKVKEDQDISSFSQKHFAPPLIRSLSESIYMALDFKEK